MWHWRATSPHRMLTRLSRRRRSETGLVYSHFRSAHFAAADLRAVAADERTEAPSKARAATPRSRPTTWSSRAARELVPLVLRSYIEAAVFHALLEAEASEYGAQMTAMDSATNNAADMIQPLTLEMNRARQAHDHPRADGYRRRRRSLAGPGIGRANSPRNNPPGNYLL